MKNKFMWIAAVVFYLAMLSCLTDVHAKQVVNLKIGNIIFGEESISVETDKGRYTLPSHFSGMLEEATFTKLLELIQNNKGKTFPFIVEKLNQFQYIVGLEEKPMPIRLLHTRHLRVK